ncbi:MAG TPA: hypothetical protein VIG33_16130 [Pseudobdellovibrionaceae bacterium]|jgi:hypothetical protein
MRISGVDLKEVIDAGLEEYKNADLTLNLLQVLQDFSSSIDVEKSYDLFCCFAQIILKSDEDAAPIIADLMKTSKTELEILGDNTFSGIGSFFDDFIKKQKLLSQFKELGELEVDDKE